MSEYNRTTRGCTLNTMHLEISAAIRTHIEHYELGDIEPNILACCETTSVKPKKGLFGKEEIITTGVILTEQWLIWGVAKANEKPNIMSALLRNIEVQDFEKTQFYKMMPDSGLNILGQYTDVTERGSIFIGFGSQPAAQNFRQLLKEAVQRINA
jgi:hypothetical protein